MVTARLRNASATWVRNAIEAIMCAGLGFMVMATVVLFQRGILIRELLLNGFIMIICITMCAFIGLPLASVSETFEYDVLRWLNNVSVLHHARKYIGDQTLPHLQALDWGFRFAGSVISSRTVGGIMFGMVTTIVASMGQAIFDMSAGQLSRW